MPRGRRRGAFNGAPPPQLTDPQLKDLGMRLGLHESKASQSTEPHHKRRPVAGSVVGTSIPDRGTPDADGNTFNGLTSAKLATNAVGAAELESHNSDDSQRAVTLDHCRNALRNPGQGTHGLRTISNTLGGSSPQCSAGDHSHGSGNSHDIDLLPEAHQRRILLARQRVRNNIRNLDTLTAAELRLYIRELAIVALSALALEIDAPDLTAEKRKAKRDAGEEMPLFSEWRLAEGGKLHDPTHPRYVEGLPDEGTVPE